MSPEELQQARADLLNRQQLELSGLDRKQAAEQKRIEKGALADWEVRFARAKLDLKEKHYREFSEALREFNPEHEAIEQASLALEELEEIKKKLEQQRKDQEEKLKQEEKGKDMNHLNRFIPKDPLIINNF